jgi:uncharacterized protein YidB (DUF937 family)
MGFLDNIFGGNQAGGSGSSSRMVLTLLALLAWRAYQERGRASDGGAAPTNSPGPLGGGLGNILSSLFPSGTGAASGNVGDLLRGALGGVLGGTTAGTALNGGLNELIRQLQQNGHVDTAQSWIGSGPNRAITPNQLESALGRDTLESLAKQTNKPYNEVLSELSQSLPEAVDKMTPNGRLPTHDEAARWA